MNCDIAQRRLMSIEDPTQVSPDLCAHLAMCGSCRDWQGQLVQLERHIAFIPVPAPRGKYRFLKRLAGTPTRKREAQSSTMAVDIAPTGASSTAWLDEPLSHKLARTRLLAGMATAFVAAVFAWWLLRPSNSAHVDPTTTRPADDPLLASLLQYDLRLATADSASKRIDVLADVAQALHDESRTLALEAPGDQLDKLAGLYEQVIRAGLIQHASAIPVVERLRVLKPIADQLEKAAHASERLLKRLPPEQARPVKAMAEVAWEGRRYLATLLQGERT